jgi:hypothetical protein
MKEGGAPIPLSRVTNPGRAPTPPAPISPPHAGPYSNIRLGLNQRALGPKEGRGATPSGMGNPRDGALLPRRSHWHHVRAVQRKSRVGNSMARAHSPCDFRHGPISPSVFSQLAARNDPAPVRKCIPCVHAGRDFRHGGRRRPRQGQNVRPACTRGTMFPTWTRQGGTFPLPAGSVALYPGRKSIPRVHTGRDFRHVPRGELATSCSSAHRATPASVSAPDSTTRPPSDDASRRTHLRSGSQAGGRDA